MEPATSRPGTKRVVIVDDMNNPPPQEPGVVFISRSRWKKLQASREMSKRVMIAVCEVCWKSEDQARVSKAHVGTMQAIAKDSSGMMRYRHQVCP